MGQQVSAVIDKFDDDTAKQKLADDALNSLIEMAKLQVAAFKLAISNPNFDAKLIPIEKILSSDSIIQASIVNTPANIGSVIGDTFSAFASGEVLKGITTLINSGLNILLGSYSGNISTRDTYLISTGKIGGVFRVDIHFFAYRFRSDQLKDITKEVLAVSVVISSAELKDLSDNTLRDIVQQTYSTSTTEEQEAIFEQIKAARDSERQPSNSETQSHFQQAIGKIRNNAPVLATTPGDHSDQVEVREPFEIRTPIGRAGNQCPLLEAWIWGGIATAFALDASEISVSCEKSSQSTSDSSITGMVTICVASSKEQVSRDKLITVVNDILRSATYRALSYLTVDSYRTQADDAGFYRFEWVKGHIPQNDRLARSSAPYYQEKDSDELLTDESIAFLKRNKIEHVISLNSQATEDEAIKKKLEDNSIAYTPLPVADFEAPTMSDLKKGNEKYRKHRKGTLVWCGYGHGRTGTMVSGLQIYAEADKTSPKRLSHDDYEKNYVEPMHEGKSTGQYEVLDELQDELQDSSED